MRLRSLIHCLIAGCACVLCSFASSAAQADDPTLNRVVTLLEQVEQLTSQSETKRSDPTAPSATISQRLAGSGTTPVVAPANAPQAAPIQLPEIQLKALVMSDDNHGTALLESAGRKLMIRLVRDGSHGRSNAPTSSSDSTAGVAKQTPTVFAIQGISFTVEDFSRSSIRLRALGRVVLVQ